VKLHLFFWTWPTGHPEMGVMAYKSTMNLDFNEIVKSIAEPVGECYNNWELVREIDRKIREG